jgi:hypothetical protein
MTSAELETQPNSVWMVRREPRKRACSSELLRPLTFSYRASRVGYGYSQSNSRQAERPSSPWSFLLNSLIALAQKLCPQSSSLIALTFRIDTPWGTPSSSFPNRVTRLRCLIATAIT